MTFLDKGRSTVLLIGLAVALIFSCLQVAIWGMEHHQSLIGILNLPEPKAFKDLDALRDEAADIQEGGTGRGFSETHRRLALTLEAFREVSGNDFFHND